MYVLLPYVPLADASIMPGRSRSLSIGVGSNCRRDAKVSCESWRFRDREYILGEGHQPQEEREKKEGKTKSCQIVFEKKRFRKISITTKVSCDVITLAKANTGIKPIKTINPTPSSPS